MKVFILLPSLTLKKKKNFFYRNSHGAASVSFEVVPMEYSTSVKETSTKVVVAKTVIIINHLTATEKSRLL